MLPALIIAIVHCTTQVNIDITSKASSQVCVSLGSQQTPGTGIRCIRCEVHGVYTWDGCVRYMGEICTEVHGVGIGGGDLPPGILAFGLAEHDDFH